MNNLLVRILGWHATVLHGDPCVFDRWLWLKKRLRPGPLRTLDAGCGSGAFTMYAARIGNDALGLSFDEHNNAAAAGRAQILRIPGARFTHVDLRELDRRLPSLGVFDQIICLETIEHILDDRKLAKNLSALLKPGGRLLLTTPYKHYRRLLGDRLSATEDGGHVRWGYTHGEMRALFAGQGLEVVEESYISGVVSQQLTNLMRLLSCVHPYFAWIAVFPLRIFQVFDAPLTRALRYPPLGIGVVAIKPGAVV